MQHVRRAGKGSMETMRLGGEVMGWGWGWSATNLVQGAVEG